MKRLLDAFHRAGYRDRDLQLAIVAAMYGFVLGYLCGRL
jgi:hypothetical protein